MTQEWTEEKLKGLMTDIAVKIWREEISVSQGVNQIHELYKKDTHLKGNKEWPKCEVEYNPLACGAEDDTDNCYRGGWDGCQEEADKAGLKSTEEWKK